MLRPGVHFSTGKELENEILYLALVKDGGLPILELDFLVGGSKYDSALLSGFVSAVQEFAKELNKRDISVIDQGDVKIALEKSANISAIYVTPFVSPEMRTTVQSILNAFEQQYASALQSSAIDSCAFEEFKEHISQILSSETIKPFYSVKTTGQVPTQSLSSDLWPIIANIDGRNTVAQITRKTNMDYQIVLEALASFKAQGLIKFQITIDMHDVPILTSKGTSFLFNSTEDYQEILSEFGDDCLDIIKALNGKKTISRLAKDSSLNLVNIKALIRMLLEKGCVEIIPDELKSILMIERLYGHLVNALTSRLGNDKTIALLSKAFEHEQNSWTRLVRFDEKGISFKAAKTYIEGQKELDKSQMLESLLIPIPLIFQRSEKVFGKKYTDKMKNEILDLIEGDFGPNDIGLLKAILL